MTKANIIDKITRDEWYKQSCKKIAAGWADDMYQDMFLIILELKDEKILELSDTCLRCWYYRVLCNQFNNIYSPFFKKYRQFEKKALEFKPDLWDTQPLDSEPVDVAAIKQAIGELGWYQQKVIELYVEEGSLRAASRESKIPVKSLHNTVKKVRQHVKKRLNDL